MKKLLMMLAVAALMAGCGEKTNAQQTSAPAKQPVPPAATDSGSRLTGTVLETQDAGGYTYVKLGTSGGEKWAAVSQASIARGQTITIDAQMTLDNFESKTLNRTFDKIIFGTVAGADAAAPPVGAAQHMTAPANTGDVTVAKAEGANALTVAEIWDRKGVLKDKPVVLRGKVVKSLNGIMGSNWLHLRDGSGSADAGTHDITVTTNDTASVGDVVVVSGVVHIDKDFGAGYLYPVIIENATIRKE